jgi:cytidylate kinase
MQPNQLVTGGEFPTLIFSHDILEKLGVKVGENLAVKVAVEGRAIVVRLIDEAERKIKLDAAMEELMERRDELYRRLAEGVQ